MTSYDKFVKEIIDIRRWLFTTIYSYNTTSAQFAFCMREGESVSEFVDRAFNESGCNEYSLVRRLSTDNIKTCKELSLIRSISALEVFVIDAVREVYDANKKPFLSNTAIEYHVGEILSYTSIADVQKKYIEQVCRKLHSGGFEDIQKYYKRTFDIEFSKFSHQIEDEGFGIDYIHRFHQIRHLIIHRLGQIDEHYKKKYNCTDANIKLSESDLSNFFEVLLSFASYIDKRMGNYILTPPPENRVEIKVELLSDIALEYFEPTFSIPLRKNVFIPLSSIMSSKEFETPNTIVLQLYGSFIHIRRYYKSLLKRASAGEIKVLSYTLLSSAARSRKIKQFSWDDVEKVIDLLPEKPWDKNIHKTIAQELGWSNNKVYRIITNILTERPVKISIGKRTIELHINDTYTFSPLVTPQEMLDRIVWQTSNSNIIEVCNGTITAISPGSAYVLARIPGNYSRAICTVTVLN